MQSNSIPTEEWGYFFFIFALGIMFLHQAWANLIQQKVSKFSIDRLMILISDSFASPKNRAETRRLSKDPKRLLIFGLFSLLAFLGFVKIVYEWIIQFLV